MSNSKENKFISKKIKKHLYEISIPEIEYDLTHLKKGLNGKIWETGGILKKEVREKLLEIAKLLLEKGAKINQQNNAWITPLISACSKRRYDVVKFLLDNNADPNIRDENGRTAICYAIQNQDFETTEILLQYGVYLSNKDKQGLYITNLLQYYYFVIDPLKKYVKRKTSIIKEELIEKYWHPDNVKKWSEFYNMDYSDVIEIM
jgi:ankyrin repeat protein